MSTDEGVNAMFYMSILTMFCGGFGLAIRYCYRLKCKEFTCGCIKIVRDIETERIEDTTKPNEETKV